MPPSLGPRAGKGAPVKSRVSAKSGFFTLTASTSASATPSRPLEEKGITIIYDQRRLRRGRRRLDHPVDLKLSKGQPDLSSPRLCETLNSLSIEGTTLTLTLKK